MIRKLQNFIDSMIVFWAIVIGVIIRSIGIFLILFIAFLHATIFYNREMPLKAGKKHETLLF